MVRLQRTPQDAAEALVKGAVGDLCVAVHDLDVQGVIRIGLRSAHLSESVQILFVPVGTM